MPPKISPNMARKRLAAKVKLLREQAGLKQDEVTERLGWGSKAKLSRIENNQQRIQPDEVEDFLDVVGHQDEVERAELKQMAKDARQRGWWQQPVTALPEDFRDYVGREAAASGLKVFEPLLFPALCQSREYARAVISGVEPGLEQDEIDRRVNSRMVRQQVLDREDDPLELWIILDEGVLHRRIGDVAVLVDQLRHLAMLAARPTVTVQVVPKSAGAYPGMTGWFCILEFPEQDVPDIGYTDGVGGSIYLEDADDVRGCILMFGHLRGMALNPTDSLALVETVINGLTQGPE